MKKTLVYAVKNPSVCFLSCLLVVATDTVLCWHTQKHGLTSILIDGLQLLPLDSARTIMPEPATVTHTEAAITPAVPAAAVSAHLLRD